MGLCWHVPLPGLFSLGDRGDGSGTVWTPDL